MKSRKHLLMIVVLAVTMIAVPLCAQGRGQSYIGVLLDSEPLSPLLSKHLRLGIWGQSDLTFPPG